MVIFSTSGKFITKFNVLRCISLSETLFWTRARGRIPITLNGHGVHGDKATFFYLISEYYSSSLLSTLRYFLEIDGVHQKLWPL